MKHAKAPEAQPTLSYFGGFVAWDSQAFILGVIDDFPREHTKMLQCLDNEFSHYRIDWQATGVVVVDEPEFQVLALKPDGSVHFFGESEGVEVIDKSNDGPSRRGMLREIRKIGDIAYVCGMGRQVYRRPAPGKWERMDAGALCPLGWTEATSFDSIDGFDDRTFYAVGLNGAIWKYAGDSWIQCDSPTTVWLKRVKCVASGTVFACGQSGTLIRGDGENFEVVQHNATNDDFVGLEWFNERLYVATATTLYEFDGERLKQVDPGFGHATTYGLLHAKDGVMWSFGRKHLAYNDGKKWHEMIVK